MGRSRHRFRLLVLAGLCGLGLLGPEPSPARADGGAAPRPPAAALTGPAESRVPIPARGAGRRASPEDPGATSTGGWGLATAGVALALAVFGGLSLAARRLNPALGAGGAGVGRVAVVGRVALGPRQAVHLIRIGDRTLLVGTGAQGAPTLLGELAPDPLRPASPAPGGPDA